jgi:hypothetical protein
VWLCCVVGGWGGMRGGIDLCVVLRSTSALHVRALPGTSMHDVDPLRGGVSYQWLTTCDTTLQDNFGMLVVATTMVGSPVQSLNHMIQKAGVTIWALRFFLVFFGTL